MDLQEFEQAILKLAFETDARITTASVAYYLGIPSRQANSYLNALLEDGVLELDSDATGNLFYVVPNQPASTDAVKELKNLLDGAPSRSRVPAPPVPEAPPRRTSFSTIDDDGEAPFNPLGSRRPSVPAPPTPEPGTAMARRDEPRPAAGDGVQGSWKRDERDKWGEYAYPDDDAPQQGLDGSAQGGRPARPAVMPTAGRWESVVTARTATPDASLNQCGASPMVVTSEVRCEPQPLPASKPMVISCSDEVRTEASEDLWFYRPDNTALVPAGESALAREYYIEQPEHQPGMALLLSLILCGTGQIYNGEVSKGIMMMVLCFLLWFVLLGWVVHIWSIVDAVVVAERLNRQTAS